MIYYIMILYMIHASFHMVQFDSLRSVVLLYSLEKTDVIEDDAPSKKKGKKDEKDIQELKIRQAQ